MRPIDIDRKYDIEKYFIQSDLDLAGDCESIEKMISALESLDVHVKNISSALNSENIQNVHNVIDLAQEHLVRLSKELGIAFEGNQISVESMRLQPYMVLTHAMEDITETLKNILYKIKEFLMYISRHIIQAVKKVGWALLDIPGDAKILRNKIMENIRPNDRINEKYGEKFLNWIQTYYPSLMFLSSPAISKFPNASGLSKILLMLSENEINLDVPDINTLYVGDRDKFSNELISFYNNLDFDISSKFFSQEQVIKDNILNVEGIDVNKYTNIDVNIYCVDAKFVYYIILAKKTTGYIRTIISKARIETFRSPQIRMANFGPLDTNLMVGNNPIEFCNVLIDEIIVNSPRIHKLINRIPGKIKELEGSLRYNIKLFEAKGQEGDIVVNLKTYSNFLKSIFRNYYNDIMSSRLNTYLFYYKFASIVYASTLGSKTS